MASYTVHMVNFNLNKGTFLTLQEAIDQARALGFECTIWFNEANKEPQYLCSVKPY